MNLLPSADETLEPFFDGKLQIIQKKRGYRFSVDPVLLSQFVRIRKNERVIDLGTGCGILPLLLSQNAKARSFVGVEIQRGLIDCAEKNVILNHVEDRVSILKQDFRELKRIYTPGSFDVVLSNPPYRRTRSGRTNLSTEKAIARHEIRATLEDLTSASYHLLPNKGRCYVIFPAARATDLLVTLRSQKLEPKRLQFVHSRSGGDAKLMLVESLKGGGVELKIETPIILEK